MMKINRENYETYFLDYHEGVLSDENKKVLFIFLTENPDLKEEFNRFELFTIPASDKTFGDKDQLKKSIINLQNYQSYFTADVEGDLNPEQKNELEIFIDKHPSLKSELEAFQNVKLKPDFTITYENKKALKRGSKVIPFTVPFFRIAIAASIALFLITYFFFRNKNESVTAHRDIQHNDNKINPGNLPSVKDSTEVMFHQPQAERKQMAEKKKIKEKCKNRNKQGHGLANRKINLNENKIEQPLLSNREGKQNANPLIQQNNSAIKDSSETLVAQNNITKRNAFKPTKSDLSKVFSVDELKELGVSGKTPPEKKNNLWDLASTGANELSKITGKDISINKQSNALENTNSYALAIGNFSISHTSNK